jgi:hypothetical protein
MNLVRALMEARPTRYASEEEAEDRVRDYTPAERDELFARDATRPLTSAVERVERKAA